MTDFLERGTEISPGVRIRKKIAEGEKWQIFCTDQETCALAADTALYGEWIERGILPEGLFLPSERFENCRVFAGRENYLVSSLSGGPFPNSTAQIEAFAISFHQAREKGWLDRAGDAVYLEEYSMLLPAALPADGAEKKPDVLFSHWISGGLDLGSDSFRQISRVMTWVPSERLKRYYEMAGFSEMDEAGQPEQTERQDAEIHEHETGSEKTGLSIQAPGEFSLPGRPALEQFFRENIIDVVLNREAYERMGISFPGATVLYGPPGTGKTYAVDRLAEYLGWQRFDINSGTIGSSYIHETSRRISEAFTKAMNSAPSILVIDEMEAFLSERQGGGGSGSIHHMEEVAEFLRKIPEAVSKGVLIFAMTNMLDSIDPAILRRGRFDHLIKVDFATKEDMEVFLQKRFADLPIAEDIAIGHVAEKLAGHPISDAAFILKDAGRLAVQRGQELINASCLDEALSRLPKKEEKRKIGF